MRCNLICGGVDCSYPGQGSCLGSRYRPRRRQLHLSTHSQHTMSSLSRSIRNLWRIGPRVCVSQWDYQLLNAMSRARLLLSMSQHIKAITDIFYRWHGANCRFVNNPHHDSPLLPKMQVFGMHRTPLKTEQNTAPRYRGMLGRSYGIYINNCEDSAS
jgi:hypothetical protein